VTSQNLRGRCQAVRPDSPWTDPGVVDEDVYAAEPGARGFGDLIGRGVVRQIGLNGEQFGRLSLLTRTRRKPFSAASETSQTRGGAMTSGWIIWARSRPLHFSGAELENTEQSVMADGVQALGQHVRQEAPNELVGWQRHGLIRGDSHAGSRAA